jgi:hypothetical protein
LPQRARRKAAALSATARDHRGRPHRRRRIPLQRSLLAVPSVRSARGHPWAPSPPPNRIGPPPGARRARHQRAAHCCFSLRWPPWRRPCVAAEAHTAAPRALPADLAALVFERLPPAEQCVTVSRLARAWRRWAASRREQLAAALQRRVRPQLPLWCVAEAWPQLSDKQRNEASLRAAACGDAERLQRLQAQDPPCPWDWKTCQAAADGGHLDVLRWLRAQDPPCPWDEQTCSVAAQGGRLDVLRWLRAQDPPCPWGEQYTCAAAAQSAHLDVLRWLRAQDPPCPWDEWTCAAAAEGGHLDVLRWLRAQDPPCPWNEQTCSNAAGSGHLDVLQWLRAQDPPCPWNEQTCRVAADSGHLDVLRWLRAQNPRCPWDKWTCQRAAGNGHLDVLRWLRAQEPPCPWDKAVCRAAAPRHADVAAWMDEQARGAALCCCSARLHCCPKLPATRAATQPRPHLHASSRQRGLKH